MLNFCIIFWNGDWKIWILVFIGFIVEAVIVKTSIVDRLRGEVYVVV